MFSWLNKHVEGMEIAVCCSVVKCLYDVSQHSSQHPGSVQPQFGRGIRHMDDPSKIDADYKRSELALTRLIYK